MDTEAFVRWALDDSRTVEERYTTELVVEQGVSWWNSRRQIYKHEGIEATMERQRQRALNPAYQPVYTEESVRKAAEYIHEFKMWFPHCYNDRPIRDIKVARFLSNVEIIHLNFLEVEDLSVLEELHALHTLHFGSRMCEDYRPLARCANLRELNLTFHCAAYHPKTTWPIVTGLDQLKQLEVLSLQGNLLAFERGVCFPNVRRAILKCEPQYARSVHDLPQLPSCHFLTLAGVERLDGIEKFPHLRNLVLETDTRDFTPLEALRELTCFTCNSFEPLDLRPLTRLPKLHCASFGAHFQYASVPVRTRDFLTLIDSPSLREVVVTYCPPVETEVAALNAGFSPCDDLFLRAEPRPMPTTPRLILAPGKYIYDIYGGKEPVLDADGFLDAGMRAFEARWIAQFVTRAINKKLGCADWGEVEAKGEYRLLNVTIESFGVVEKLPEIIDATRHAVARLKDDYVSDFHIYLKAPKVIPTDAQKKLEEQFRNEQDRADYERGRVEDAEYLERLHRYELKKEEGQSIIPEEFAPGDRIPLPPPPWEREDEDEDSDDPNSGDIAVKKKPDPPPSWFDDEHPLADNYRMFGRFDLEKIHVSNRDESLITYLMRRPPDEIIPEEEKK